MSLWWLCNLIRLQQLTRIISTWAPLLIYSATWVTLLTLTVAVASLSPEVAFVSAISPSSSFSQKCTNNNNIKPIIHNNNVEGSTNIRVPLDFPGDTLCFPVELFFKSRIDLIVPPIFAAVVVAASAFVVLALGLWEHDQH
ncbi:uncharacterized protein LOC130962272 [Arachis stenosperma]|uniref:uncharacterized protein LOC130962272 n=1 Tax=Arachis stenosperma TaxID=217475 RepID=UPI0025AC3580|nr:uncharacterized protein LOC130962272 [Arachis stenosperma]